VRLSSDLSNNLGEAEKTMDSLLLGVFGSFLPFRGFTKKKDSIDSLSHRVNMYSVVAQFVLVSLLNAIGRRLLFCSLLRSRRSCFTDSFLSFFF
jgi:hypothetical protein